MNLGSGARRLITRPHASCACRPELAHRHEPRLPGGVVRARCPSKKMAWGQTAHTLHPRPITSPTIPAQEAFRRENVVRSVSRHRGRDAVQPDVSSQPPRVQLSRRRATAIAQAGGIEVRQGPLLRPCCMAGGDASQKCSYYARSAVAQQEADRLRAIDDDLCKSDCVQTSTRRLSRGGRRCATVADLGFRRPRALTVVEGGGGRRGGGRAFTRPRGGRVARRCSSKQSKAKQDKGNKQHEIKQKPAAPWTARRSQSPRPRASSSSGVVLGRLRARVAALPDGLVAAAAAPHDQVEDQPEHAARQDGRREAVREAPPGRVRRSRRGKGRGRDGRRVGRRRVGRPPRRCGRRRVGHGRRRGLGREGRRPREAGRALAPRHVARRQLDHGRHLAVARDAVDRRAVEDDERAGGVVARDEIGGCCPALERRAAADDGHEVTVGVRPRPERAAAGVVRRERAALAARTSSPLSPSSAAPWSGPRHATASKKSRPGASTAVDATGTPLPITFGSATRSRPCAPT